MLPVLHPYPIPPLAVMLTGSPLQTVSVEAGLKNTVGLLLTDTLAVAVPLQTPPLLTVTEYVVIEAGLT